MEQSAVIEGADTRDERRADEDADDLGTRGSVEGKEHRDHDGGVHRQAAQKRNRREMNFARPRKINHSNTQRQGAYGDDEHQRCEKCDEKSEQACGHATSCITWVEASQAGAAGVSRDPLRIGDPAPKSSLQTAAPRSLNTILRF